MKIFVRIGTAAILVVLFLTSCSIFTDSSTGVLVLNFSPRLTASTIEPDVDMTTAYYDIYGSTTGDSFEQLGVTGSTIVQSSLVPGTWTIDIEAYNADDIQIGEGQLVVEVLAGQVLSETIVVNPVVGIGTLEVDITWPPVLTNPTISATLTPNGDPIPFNVAGDAASYIDATLANGYYLLAVTLFDDGTPVWGTVEAARIITGQTSYRLYQLVEDVNRGRLDLEITEELDNPIEITFDPVPATDPLEVPANTNFEITAVPSETVDSYQWYLAGQPVAGATSATFAYSFVSADIGFVFLDVVVTAGDVLSSETVRLEIVDAGVPE